MRIKILLLFLILVLTVYVLFNEDDKEDKIKVKKVKTKKRKLKRKKLILYWTNWCGVCQKIKPNWNKAKELLMLKYPQIRIEDINCDNLDKNTSYILENGVKESLDGVPTILLRDGINDIEYGRGNGLKGDRSVDDLVTFYEINL